jgi:hypothetical protein
MLSVATATLSVYGPPDLQNQFPNATYDDIPFIMAKFSAIPFSGTLLGRLYSSDPADACSPPLDRVEIPLGEQPILLADKGVCSFEDQAKRAQYFGANLLIVSVPDEEYQDTLNIGGIVITVDIPVIIISDTQGSILRNYINSNPASQAQMSIAFPAAFSEKTVKMDFWYSADDVEAYEFITNMSNYLWDMNSGWYVDFRPRVVTLFDPISKLGGWNRSTPACVSNGRYCATQFEKDHTLSAAWAIREDLSHLCIYQTWGIDGYLNYILLMHSSCITNASIAIEVCSATTLERYFARWNDTNKYDWCIQNSFGGDVTQSADNTILSYEREKFLDTHVQRWPALYIDNVEYTEPISNVIDVVKYSCNQLTSKPSICFSINNTGDSGSGDAGTVILWILFSTLLASGVYCVVRRKCRSGQNDSDLQLKHLTHNDDA